MMMSFLPKLVAALGLAAVCGAALAAEAGSLTASYPALERVYRNMAEGGNLRVAFLGGSITWGACASDPLKTSYRALVSAHMEQQFPNAHLRFIDAAIGGMPSKLAVFRMDRDVLPYKPDLVFVEYAVNDFEAADTQETMEGIVRKLHNSCPNAAVVIVIIGSNYEYHTPAQAAHTELAKYYGLPVVDICAAVQERIKKGLDTHSILFDGCHPNDRGYRLYTDVIVDRLTALQASHGPASPYPDKPLTQNRYETASIIELSKLPDLGGWRSDSPSVVGTWFDQQPSRWQSSAIAPTKDGAALEFDLECRALGLYYETTKEGGTLLLEADSDKVIDVSTDMDMPLARVGFTVKMLETSAPWHIRLSAPRCGKGTKVAYLFYTR